MFLPVRGTLGLGTGSCCPGVALLVTFLMALWKLSHGVSGTFFPAQVPCQRSSLVVWDGGGLAEGTQPATCLSLLYSVTLFPDGPTLSMALARAWPSVGDTVELTVI